MKTLIVLSDTHGNLRAFEKIKAQLSECDFIVHLGDTSSDGNALRKYNQNVISVNGNCDPINLGADEDVLEIEGVRIFICHGHRYSVKSTKLKLAARAKELNCSLALYGHTHTAAEEVVDGVTLINPGCMTRYAQNSYLYLVLSGGKAVSKIVPFF